MQVLLGRKELIEPTSVLSVALSAILLIFAVAFFAVGFYLIAPMKEARSAEDPNAGRYYVGLGIVIEKEERGIRVKRVYPGSPAKQEGLYGLEPNDLIIGVDGVSATKVSIQKFQYAARYGAFDAPMWFLVERELLRNASQNALVVFPVHVKRGLVDGSADILRDYITGSVCGGANEKLLLLARVSEDSETGEFTYWHKIINDSDEQVLIQSELLDRLANGSWNGLQVFHFKPYESREFVLKTKDWPTKREYYVNKLSVASNDISERISKWGFSGHSLGRDYALERGCGMVGFLPESSTKRQGN